MSTETFSVDNIHCEACARRVTNALVKADAAAVVSVDVKTGAVTVAGASVPRDRLTAALADAGYPLRP
jgi:copper chaperone CopZ